MDHSIASVRRYTGLKLSRSGGVPSHMVVDSEARVMYVCDTGADRVLRVEIDSGYYARDAKVRMYACMHACVLHIYMHVHMHARWSSALAAPHATQRWRYDAYQVYHL